MPECWLPIPGWTGSYEVSDHGNVRSVTRTVTTKNGRRLRVRGGPMRLWVTASGRATVRLRDSSTDRHETLYVYTAVLSAFRGPRPAGQDGRHLDDDPGNNHLDNLAWGTRQDNVDDMLRHGRKAEQLRMRCPRRHPLRSPNLVPSKAAGHRECLACARAKSYLRRAEPNYSPARLQEEADRQYASLVAHPGRRQTRPAGEAHGNAKMTDDKVVQLRRERAAGTSTKELAARYQVSLPTVRKIITGERWGHIT